MKKYKKSKTLKKKDKLTRTCPNLRFCFSKRAQGTTFNQFYNFDCGVGLTYIDWLKEMSRNLKFMSHCHTFVRRCDGKNADGLKVS